MNKGFVFENTPIAEIRRGSRNLSRVGGGGADFQKTFENFVDFFKIDQIDYLSSPKPIQRS